MECLYLKEKYIFSSNISVLFNNTDLYEITLLLTIDALYFFEKKK